MSIPQSDGRGPITIKAVGYDVHVPGALPIDLTVNDAATSAVLELGKEGIRVGGATFATHAADRLAESAQQGKP